MKREKISWVVVMTETTIGVWTRGSGSMRVGLRPVVGGIVGGWAVAKGLLKGGGSGRIYAVEVYEQVVRLRGAQVEGLSEGEIRKVLSYEVEPFSQIGVEDAALVYEREGEEWRVIEMSKREGQEVVKQARRDGFRVEGFGAVPEGVRGWTQEEWRGDVGKARLEALAGGGLWIPVGEVLGEDEKGRGGTQRQAILAGALCLVCGMYMGLTWVNGGVKREMEVREESRRRVEGLRAEVDGLRRQVGEEAGKREAEVAAADRLGRKRRAWSEFLGGLERASVGGVVVQRIRSTGVYCAEVEGYCSGTEGSARVMEALSEATAGAGWVITPKEMRRAVGTGLTRFTFLVEVEK